MIRLLLSARHVLFLAAVALLAILIVADRKVSYEQSIKSFFAEDDPAIVDYRRAGVFGDDNFVFVAYDDPRLLTPDGMARVAELAAGLAPSKIPGVIRVESIDAMPLLWQIDEALIAMQRLPAFLRDRALKTIRGQIESSGASLASNTLSIRSAIQAADESGRKAIGERLVKHPLFVGTLIDRSANKTAIVVRLDKNDRHDVKACIASIRDVADQFAVRHQLNRPAVVGPPVLLADGFTSIEVDGRRLATVGMILIGVVTLTAIRSLWWALVPLLSGWLVWLVTEAILSIFQLKLSLSGGPLVAQIIVLTMPAASHLAIHFRDDRRNEPDRRKAAISALSAVWVPIFWCSITGAIGYAALLTSNVVPIQQFGWIMGTCTLLASLLVFAISPIAMLPPIPLEIPVRHGSKSRLAAVLNGMTVWVLKHPLPIVATILAVVLPLASGIPKLTYESNYINAFRQTARVVVDYKAVESALGGIGVVELILPVREVDSALLSDLKAIETGLGDAKPGVPHASSVLTLRTILDPDERILALAPEARDWILKTKLDLILASPQAELLKGFWNAEGHLSRVLVRLVEQQPAGDKAAIFRQVLDAGRAGFGPDAFLTGLSYLMTKTTQGVILTQWTTFLWSAVGIFAMLTIAFRGPILAILAILPTMLSIVVVLGLMGWTGVKLDMATALVASVALGLSVDDTFHCLLQYRRSRKTRPFEESLLASYAVSGPGVLLSSVAVAIGFSALQLSEFTPFCNFGLMVGIATAGSTLGNLILLPACLTLGHRWFPLKRDRERTPTA